MCLSINGNNKVTPVHKLVYLAFYGPIPEAMTINHIDENYLNNHYLNLELMSRSENIKSFLKNNKNEKKYSDTLIEMICLDLSHGFYYRDVAVTYGLPLEYVYRIAKGKKRLFVSHQYLPFPASATIKRKDREIPFSYIQALIKQNYSNTEIFELLDMHPSNANYKVLSRERKKIGIRDPRYFSEEFIAQIDECIKSGKSNNEIYKLFALPDLPKYGYLLARERQKTNLRDFNPDGVPLVVQENIIDDIMVGFTNKDLRNKYDLEKSYYTTNMLARLRQKVKKM